jgi:phosphatidylserine synthase
MATVNQRLFNNAYFRSIDALLLLASFRFATLVEWLPWLLAFTAAVLLDGSIVRQIKSKEFRQHDPELFALYACGAIIIVCATVVGFVVPVTLHPLAMPCVPLAISLLLSRAVGSFHRRG